LAAPTVGLQDKHGKEKRKIQSGFLSGKTLQEGSVLIRGRFYFTALLTTQHNR
jgi:hypothetical protein